MVIRSGFLDADCGSSEEPITTPGPTESDIRFSAVHQVAGVPVAWHDDPAGWDGWTAGGVRAGLELLAGGAGGSANQLLREMTVADFALLERRVAEARAAVEPLEVAARGRRPSRRTPP